MGIAFEIVGKSRGFGRLREAVGPRKIVGCILAPFWNCRSGFGSFGLASVPRSRRRALVSGSKLKYGSQSLVDIVPVRKGFAVIEGNPSSCKTGSVSVMVPLSSRVSRRKAHPHTLIFAVPSLNLLMNIFLDLTLQYPSTSRLVKARRFQNVRGIYPVIVTSSHNMFLQVISKLELPHRNLDWAS